MKKVFSYPSLVSLAFIVPAMLCQDFFPILPTKLYSHLNESVYEFLLSFEKPLKLDPQILVINFESGDRSKEVASALKKLEQYDSPLVLSLFPLNSEDVGKIKLFCKLKTLQEEPKSPEPTFFF